MLYAEAGDRTVAVGRGLPGALPPGHQQPDVSAILTAL